MYIKIQLTLVQMASLRGMLAARQSILQESSENTSPYLALLLSLVPFCPFVV